MATKSPPQDNSSVGMKHVIAHTAEGIPTNMMKLEEEVVRIDRKLDDLCNRISSMQDATITNLHDRIKALESQEQKDGPRLCERCGHWVT